MDQVEFTMATGLHERGRPLAEGRVQVEGLKLQSLMFKNNGARHDRFLNGEFDAAELSFALFLRLWSRGADFEAIPVFFNRQFRHGSIYIKANAGIRDPRDLRGKRIGILSWFNTAALWARGALQHEYGIALDQVEWVSGDATDTGADGLPARLRLSTADGNALTKMLVAGEIAALITPRTPSRDHPEVMRLFPDFRSEEETYYRKTGAYPISHAFVVRKRFLTEYPWLVSRLFRACEEARLLAAEYADDPEHSMLAWYGAQMEREAAILAPDAAAYGIEPNRKTLETLVTYGYAAGLLPRRPAIEELFVMP